MKKEKKYCPCCGREMFEFALGSKKVFICSYAPCQTKYYADSDTWDIDKKDKITAKQEKQIKYINRQLYSDFSAISKVQAEEIIDNYYNLAKLVKRGE